MAATSTRRRIGRTIRRPRNANTANTNSGNASAATGTPSGGGLQLHLHPIEENAVISTLPLPPALSATSSICSVDSVSSKRKAAAISQTAPSPSQHSATSSQGSSTSTVISPEDVNERVQQKKQKALELLEQMQLRVRARQEDIRRQAEVESQNLQGALNTMLLKLPSFVVNMPWESFIEEYDGNIAKATQGFRERAFEAGKACVPPPKSCLKAPPTVRSKDRPTTPGTTKAHVNFQTPAAIGRSHQAPNTVLRTARKGEISFSSNGSPIVPATVVKAPPQSVITTVDEETNQPKALWTVDEHRQLDLENPDHLNQLTDQDRERAIKALQARIDAYHAIARKLQQQVHHAGTSDTK